ncbi:hypothetical protein PIGHUM_00590 [Pigmentiphaga humi]|uniref:beta-lactamase n=1 Tax=Pigmentiphaga humi TaxID=2478468 RepID=A0A3P4AWW8_9BURK|nr:serine hydrolase [Pigmentiphaga humi]VCU68533.1 hypothetical protein PIGHUM_00590 [Pigmentiphaga humi]
MVACSSPSDVQRRRLLKLTAAALATQAAAACGGDAQAASGDASAAVLRAVDAFGAMAPEGTHCLVQADGPDATWSASYSADRQLFVGSAVKTFVLGRFLLDVETGYNGTTEAMPGTISDLVRSPGSPVFLKLNGELPFTHVLEAMISHSDNTATDMAFGVVAAPRVRQLIASAGLDRTRVPDSTRRLFSYLAGADDGVDLGWVELMKRLSQPSLPNARPAVNDRQSMLSTATDMVRWYRQTLGGKIFSQDGTLREFRRISAMANAVAAAVPAGIAGYGKGGSIDWDDFHALSFPGQMVVDGVPVTFCFTYNWSGGEDSTGAPSRDFVERVAAVLQACADAVRA